MTVLKRGLLLVLALALVALAGACSDPKDPNGGPPGPAQPAIDNVANPASALDAGPTAPFGNAMPDGSVGPNPDGGAAERCGDGLDNDDDSAVDERCMCGGAASQECYGGPPEQAGVGVCARGEQSCEAANEFSTWGECTGWVPGGDEQCNTLDDDCDGTVDESCCSDDDERSCYSGPAGTENVGICRSGAQVCARGDWGACAGEVTPEAAETCGDELDNDCDGMIDEDCECIDATVAAPAAGGEHADILILERSVAGGLSSQEALAAATNGYSVEIVDDATWSAMTIAEFAAYRAIVLGDANCEFTERAGRLSAASDNAAVWGAAVTGNVIIIGTDQSLHAGTGGQPLNEDGIDFAASRPGRTGAFVSLGCDYHDTEPGTPVPYLAGLGTDFTVGRTPSECFNDAYIVAAHPALANVTSASLSNWSCSVHETFDSWPANYEVLAIARHVGGSFTAPDGTQGTPYILARGVIPTDCGNGALQAPEECDDGNNANGDGCDEACNVEVCGDRVQQAAETCDDGNTVGGDGCSATCQVEPCFVSVCGDGIVQRGEECDDGTANSDTGPSACRTTCARPRCGDGVIDRNETCDDGPANSNTAADACRRNCTPAACGDGILDSSEQCDDHNTTSGDGCDADCTLTCFQTTASVNDHATAGRAYSVTSGVWPFETTRWYAQGSGTDLGTSATASVTLHEEPFGSGVWLSGPCP